ncbi:hypothetical protein M8J75_007796 [Diaphorina citri]|nr:hypothetical protein M8J75_007796 [Diaphorina citri]KAI5707638.1 hypothetical protein M8J77_006514 [Diaphorina citri]
MLLSDMNKLWLFFLSTFITYLFIHVWKHRRYYYLGHKIPGAPLLYLKSFFSMEAITRAYIDVFDTTRSNNKLKTMGKVWLGPKLAVVVMDPDLTHELLRHNLQKADFYRFLDETIKNGIFRENLIPKWAHRRRTIGSSAFKLSALKSYVEIFFQESSILANKLAPFAKTHLSFEPVNFMSLASLSMILRATCGVDFKIQQRHHEEHPFITAVEKAFEIFILRVVKPWLGVGFILSLFGYKKLLDQACKTTRAFTENIIEKIKTKIVQENSTVEDSIEGQPKIMEWNMFGDLIKEQPKITQDQRKTLDNASLVPLHEVLDLSKETFVEILVRDHLTNTHQEQRITYSELIDEVLTVVGAGYDTTKTTNSLTLIMLALHPNIQQEVYDEIVQVLGDDPETVPTYDQIQELHLLSRVIKETLRLYPAAPIIARNITRETQAGKYTIPNGAMVAAFIYQIHRDPRHWSNPHCFQPDRFLPSEISRRNPNAYLPFSSGPRNCVGSKYGMLQMKTTLSTLLKRYRVLPGDKCRSVEDVRFEFGMTLRLLAGNDIRLEPRGAHTSLNTSCG